MTKHTLEPTAQQIAGATSKPSFPHKLGPDGAPKVLPGNDGCDLLSADAMQVQVLLWRPMAVW